MVKATEIAKNSINNTCTTDAKIRASVPTIKATRPLPSRISEGNKNSTSKAMFTANIGLEKSGLLTNGLIVPATASPVVPSKVPLRIPAKIP